MIKNGLGKNNTTVYFFLAHVVSRYIHYNLWE